MFGSDDSQGMTFRWVMKMAGEANLSRPYAQHPWVHACVSAIAKAVSSVPLVLRKETSGGVDPVESGALYDLLRRPNKLMSQRKFLKSITQTQQLYGETMLIMMSRSAGSGVISYVDPQERFVVPEELWPVRGDLLEEIIDERTLLPRAWRMATKAGSVEIPDDSLVHISEANPYNPIRGMGPMQAAYRTAAKDFVLDRYDEALLQNSGSPGGVLSVDGHLTDADQRAISDAWREAHGRPDSHRKTAVLPNGTKYEEIGFTPQEMEFQQMRVWNRETIMSIFGVTKPIIGLTEGLNYASSVSAFRSFYEVTVIPFLDFISDELQTKFIDRLRGPESEYLVGFDTSGVAALREDADSKVERAMKLFKDGARTFTEAADLAGWDIGDTELENDEIAFVPSGHTQLVVDDDGLIATAAPAPAPVPEADEQDEEDEADITDEDVTDEAELEGEDEDTPNRSYNRAMPPGLESIPAQQKYWDEWDSQVQRGEDRIAKATKRVLRDLVLSIRQSVRDAAAGPWQEYPVVSASGIPATTKPKRKAVVTEAAIQRLLDINQAAWSAELYAAMGPRVLDVLVDAADWIHGEIDGPGLLLSATDPVSLRYLASKELVLKGISTTLIDEIQRSIVRQLALDDSVYTSLREAIWHSLPGTEEYLSTTMKGLGTRASLIARTEATGAANYGRQRQLADDGVLTNIWLSQPSARPHHAELTGKEVAIGDSFGYGLTYPGDPAAPVGEIANCRCVLLPGTQRDYS